jgi:hypothetical protein
MSITLAQFERIDGLLSKQIRAGQFETCADPRQYIITSNILLDACADALGYEFTERYASAEALRCRHRYTGIAMRLILWSKTHEQEPHTTSRNRHRLH